MSTCEPAESKIASTFHEVDELLPESRGKKQSALHAFKKKHRMQRRSVSVHPDDCQLCKAGNPGWFCKLAPRVLAEYDAIGKQFGSPAGSVLFQEGQPPRSVFLLREGRVKLTISSRKGKTFLVKIARPGDFLGLSAALSGTPYEVTAQAMEPVKVTLFQQKEFLDFIRQHVEGSLQAAKSLNSDYRSILKDMCCLALYHSIASRVAYLLFCLAIENENAEQPQPRIQLLLTHEDIASMISSSRESVTRALNSFKRQGIISVDGSEVTILRKAALELLL